MNDWPELGWSEEITACWENGPRAKYAKILDRALELANSVPYSVTLRWLFYGLWQEGWFSDVKKTRRANAKRRAYEDFSSLMSRLRHSSGEFQDRWPIELADDRRDPIHRSSFFASASEWLEACRERLNCSLDKMIGQEQYVMVAFEAEAMQSQFKYFTEPYGVSLWPFSGAASIPYKQRIASHIELVEEKFDLPVTILYFGDYDQAGLTIPESAFRHIRAWCDVEFDAFRVGLNQDQIQTYNIQEDPEKPGKFQWEAVADAPAREIITGALDTLLCLDTIREIEQHEQEMTNKARLALSQIDGGDNDRK
jgi:hypothetical protein